MITLTNDATDELNSIYQEVFDVQTILSDDQLSFLISMMLENNKDSEDALLYIKLSGDDGDLFPR